MVYDVCEPFRFRTGVFPPGLIGKEFDLPALVTAPTAYPRQKPFSPTEGQIVRDEDDLAVSAGRNNQNVPFLI
jgi:hypothetical protein